MLRYLASILALCLIASTAQAALLGRLPMTPGGADYQAFFDDELDITWLADASYVQTSGYDVDGVLSWSEALDWIVSLNGFSHLGKQDWRLPAVIDTGAPGCNIAFTGTDCGYNVDLASSEMAHLFYSTLGNVGYYGTNSEILHCGSSPPYCLRNSGPFSNLQPGWYWSGTEYALAVTNSAWIFNFRNGRQNDYERSGFGNPFGAWAVRSGDIAPVPLPPTLWLLGSAAGLLSVLRPRGATKPSH